MQNGFSVRFSDFTADRLATPGARVASTPDGMEPATEIPIEYIYPLEGSETGVQARLVMECPMMRTTAKGIQLPKPINGKANETGKPAVQVVFDMTNPEHVAFVGSFGNFHEYTEDDEGRTVQSHKNPVKATGCLGTTRDWCIYQYALFLASKKGKSTPTSKQFEEAEAKVLKKIFWMLRTHTEGPLKGQIDEDSNPMRFFKLMTYRPGTPEENTARFCLPDGTSVDRKILYGRCFLWTPFLSFRRIFDGATFSVTMEVTEAIINDFIETSVGIPIRSSRLVERLSKENPDQAALVAEKYRLLQEGVSSETKMSGIKVDDVVVDDSNPVSMDRPTSPLDDKRETTSDTEETRVEPSSRRRPVLPRRKD